MVKVLNETDSVFQHFLAEVRDKEVQKDRMRFRRNLERIGEVLAYEISKGLSYEEDRTETPLGGAEIRKLTQQPVLATILRAGLPFHNGFLNYFDQAESAFLSAYRKPLKNDPEEFEIRLEYMACPPLQDRILILTDPMLASGSSLVTAYKALIEMGRPSKVIVSAIIASDEGVGKVKRNMPENTEFWIGALDKELTAQSYIVPGLGDAGDLAFGSKESTEQNDE
ncbi:MAG: uracil phosphoribosyltransferase [Flavobacteriales bacterium]